MSSGLEGVAGGEGAKVQPWMAPSFGLETAEQKSQTQILSIGYSILFLGSFWGHQDEEDRLT